MIVRHGRSSWHAMNFYRFFTVNWIYIFHQTNKPEFDRQDLDSTKETKMFQMLFGMEIFKSFYWRRHKGTVAPLLRWMSLEEGRINMKQQQQPSFLPPHCCCFSSSSEWPTVLCWTGCCPCSPKNYSGGLSDPKPDIVWLYHLFKLPSCSGSLLAPAAK